MHPELSETEDMTIEGAAMTVVAEVHEAQKYYSKYFVILT